MPIWRNGTVCGAASPITSDIRKAPRMPSTEPTAAPISRFRLTCFRRISKKIIEPARRSPAAAEIHGGEPSGRRKAAAEQREDEYEDSAD